MYEKFNDLAEQVYDDTANITLFQIRKVLRWLDVTPDQVPVRTITEVRQSDVDRVTRNASDRYARGVYAGLLIAKAKIVPDLEPTNAEQINEAYTVWDRCPQNFTFGEYLDRLGWVKAGGDDDH